MESKQLELLILEFVQRPGYKPLKPRAIAKKLKLSEEDQDQAKRVVKRLVKSGQLTYGPNHLVRPVGVVETGSKSSAQRGKLVQGVFRRTSSGYGFVRPLGTTPQEGRSADIFIPPRSGADAADGDTVAVKITRKKHGPELKLSGEVVEVLERETHQFVGSYFESAGAGYVQVDGGVFAQPIAVGDPGAKGAREDDVVVMEMVRFPSHVHDGEGVIVDILGKRGDPGVDTLAIIHEYNLPGDFPEDVLEDARHRADDFDESIAEGRLDLTAETIITIDPVDARDFDDAISLERLENGHWRLGVHIADVSHFVQRKSPLDREARERATSIYLPDRVIPMLPEIISNNLASLQPDRVRYAKTALIEFTADGARVAVDLQTTAIKSKRRFTYEEVDDFLADRKKWKEKLKPEVWSLLGRMHELAMILRKRRFKRGSLELSMREVKVELDADGRVTGAHKVENTESHQIIEEFMLAANEAVADQLKRKETLFLRRIHENPDPRKLQALTEFVRELGIECVSLESRFEIQRVLELVDGTAESHAVNFATLRSMQKAVYSPADEGHYALASDCYCHFTSPIRRYPDLTVHRLFDVLASGESPVNDFGALDLLGQHCSEREQRAEAAERELTKVKMLSFLEEKVGEQMDAVVTGVESFGLFVLGIELPAEGLVHISSLEDDYYHYDRAAHVLTGRRAGNRYRLGDVVRVEIARVDIERRELDFRLIKLLMHADTAIGKSGGKQGGKFSDNRNPKAKSRHGKKDGKGRKKDGKKKGGKQKRGRK